MCQRQVEDQEAQEEAHNVRLLLKELQAWELFYHARGNVTAAFHRKAAEEFAQRPVPPYTVLRKTVEAWRDQYVRYYYRPMDDLITWRFNTQHA